MSQWNFPMLSSFTAFHAENWNLWFDLSLGSPIFHLTTQLDFFFWWSSYFRTNQPFLSGHFFHLKLLFWLYYLLILINSGKVTQKKRLRGISCKFQSVTLLGFHIINEIFYFEIIVDSHPLLRNNRDPMYSLPHFF